jgi:hypothetical protein
VLSVRCNDLLVAFVPSGMLLLQCRCCAIVPKNSTVHSFCSLSGPRMSSHPDNSTCNRKIFFFFFFFFFRNVNFFFHPPLLFLADIVCAIFRSFVLSSTTGG